MRKLGLTLAMLMAFQGVLPAAEGPVCPKCERIREYNRQHPENNYYWYDDYLKEKGETNENNSPKDVAATDSPAKPANPQK